MKPKNGMKVTSSGLRFRVGMSPALGLIGTNAQSPLPLTVSATRRARAGPPQ